MKHKYSSLLRVPICYTQGKFYNQFTGMLEKYRDSFDLVVFFGTWSHDAVSLGKASENLNRLKPAMAEAKRLGYKVGINNLSTLGHHEEIPDYDMQGMDLVISHDGSVKKGVLCPTSEKTLEYIKNLYIMIAETGAEIIYVDDDMDYNAHCYCHKCMNDFSRNEVLTREKLMELFSSDDIEIRKRSRLAWLDFYRKKLGKIFHIIEKAVHSVDKNITLGFMPCNVGGNGMGTENWAKELLGGSETILCRPGGGLYTDHATERIMEKANNIARQIRYLPNFASAQSEIENFPCQSLRKSIRFTGLEVLTYLAAGCSGTTWNVLAWDNSDMSEAEKYFDLARNIKPFAEKLVDTFGRSTPNGVGSYWDQDSGVNIGKKIWLSNTITEDEFFKIGLPACYDPERMSVFVLNAEIAKNLTEAQIMFHLKSGVFMDGEAVEVLNLRGYSEYTGFKVSDRYYKNVVEKNIKHDINKEVEDNVRNIRLEFCINGHPEFGKAEAVCALEKTDVKAEYITELNSYDEQKLGYSCGIFENKLGGRVCVSGYAPFNWCYNFGRNVQIKNIFVWLSKAKMPAYLKSFEKVALWQRKTTDNREGVVLSNFSLDSINNLEINVLSNDTIAQATIFDGKNIIEYGLTQKKDCPNYSTITIPFMPALSVGFITYNRREI